MCQSVPGGAADAGGFPWLGGFDAGAVLFAGHGSLLGAEFAHEGFGAFAALFGALGFREVVGADRADGEKGTLGLPEF